MSLAELAEEIGTHKTTAHRTLAALRFRGYAAQDITTGRYALGASAVRLADQYFAEDDLPTRLHGALVALCSAADELVHLGVLSGTQVVYVDKVEPARPVRVWSAVGRRSWAATTALGRALLAFSDTPPSSIEDFARAAGRRTLSGRELAASLAQARRRGYASEIEENEPGIACLAVPLLRRGRPVAAMSITAPVDRLGPQRMEELHALTLRVVVPLLPEGLSLPA